MNHRIVVLGAGYAGMMAAVRLSTQTRHADITLINASDQFVERIRMHQRATGQALKQRPILRMLRGTGVKFLQGRATHVNVEAHTVEVDSRSTPVPYDKLVYALGSVTNLYNVPGAADHALPVESPKFDEALARLAVTGGHLLIVGGGLTGIESATEIAESMPNIRVTLLTRGVFGDDLSQKGRAHIRATCARLGIDIQDKTTIAEVRANAALTTSGETVPFDLCLWTGSFTAPALARDAGLSVNPAGQIRTDSYMRSVSHPDVFAIGDAAAPVERPGAPIRMGCVTAMPMAHHTASNIAALLNGKAMKPYSFAYIIRCISLGRRNALVQWVQQDDTPRERITTGRLGVFVKEAICKYTVSSLGWEKRIPGTYWWQRWSAEPVRTYLPEHSVK